MMTSTNRNIFHVTGQWRGALMFSLICVGTNGWVNNGDVGDLRRHWAHYAVTVSNLMRLWIKCTVSRCWELQWLDLKIWHRDKSPSNGHQDKKKDCCVYEFTRDRNCPACRTYLIATRFWVVVICPIIKCFTVLEFSFILFDLFLFITIFNFILNYVPIVAFWIFTYHKIWILLIIFCFIWNYWFFYFLTCLEVFWSVVS